MQLFARVPDFDFMSGRRVAVLLSCVIIFFSLGSIGNQLELGIGLRNLGLGTRIQKLGIRNW